ncbi:MAG: hypothetical protein LCH41_12190 [Armatimonadetes bacterium]|nr:hypothetical protein [Armatimonadota bacterium]
MFWSAIVIQAATLATNPPRVSIPQKEILHRRYQDGDEWEFQTTDSTGQKLNEKVTLRLIRRTSESLTFLASQRIDWPTPSGLLRLEPVVEAEFFQSAQTGDVYAIRHRGRVETGDLMRPFGEWESWTTHKEPALIFPGRWDRVTELWGGGSPNFVASPQSRIPTKYLRKETLDTTAAQIEALVFGMTPQEVTYESWFVPQLGSIVSARAVSSNPALRSTTYLRASNVTLQTLDGAIAASRATQLE